MLDIAQIRCPEAEFILADMGNFNIEQPLDLITCFLYSMHYNDGIEKLQQCIASVYNALSKGGIFCFNTVGESKIWHDEHPMVSISFDELEQWLQPYFEVHIFEHDYDKITPWDQVSGNGIFVCVKR